MPVQLDEQLLEILACPSDDHAPLTAGTAADPDADVLTCTACGRQFPVRDGIPVLLLDEAVLPEPTDSDTTNNGDIPSSGPSAKTASPVATPTPRPSGRPRPPDGGWTNRGV